MSCLNNKYSDLLLLYLDGDLDSQEQEEFARHIEECSSCRAELSLLSDVTAALDKGTKQIKEKWNPPTSEEMVEFTLFPHKMKKSRKEEIKKYFTYSSYLREEIELLKESPSVDGETEEGEVPAMPSSLMDQYRKLYGQKRDKNSRKNFFTEFMEKINLLWGKPLRMAYGFMVFLILIGSILVVNDVLPGLNNYTSNSLPHRSPVRYVSLPTGDDGSINRENLLSELRNRGISAKIEKGVLLVPGNRLREARDVFLSYQSELIMSAPPSPEDDEEITPAPEEETPPTSPAPEEEPSLKDNPSTPDKPIEVKKQENPSLPSFTTAQQDDYPLGTPIIPSFTPTGDNSQDRPQPGNITETPDPTPHTPYYNPGNNAGIMALNSPAVSEKIEYKAFTTDISGASPPDWALAMHKSRSGIVSKKSAYIRPERYDAVFDTQDKEAYEERIQKNFREKVEELIKDRIQEDSSAELKKVTVFVELSDKTDAGIYQVRSVNILITTTESLTDQQKEVIRDTIRQGLNLEEYWDKAVNFAVEKKKNSTELIPD